MLQGIELDSGVPLDVGRQIRGDYARHLRLAIDVGASAMPAEAMPYHSGKSREGHTLVGTKSIGPSGPGFLGSASSYISCNTLAGGAADWMLELPAGSDWSCQFVVDNVGVVSGTPCWFRSGATASSSNLFLASDTRRPWVRINSVDVLRPASGAQWTDGQSINLVIRNRSASRVEAWWDGVLKHSATHSTSLPAIAGIDAIYYLLTNSLTDQLRGNAAAIRFWSRYLADQEIAELAADAGRFYEPPQIWLPIPAGGTTYNVDLTESATPTDAVSMLATLAAALSEATSATDSTSALGSFGHSISEAADAADAVSATASLVATLTEAASAADAVSAIVTLGATVSESVSATDVYAAVLVAVAAVSEAASATDASSWSGTAYSADLAESVTATDAIAAAAQLVAQVAEAVSAGDAAAASAASLVGLITESATATDSVAAGGSTYSVTLAELATALDVVVGVIAGGVEVRAALSEARRLRTPGAGGRPAQLSSGRRIN